MSRPTAKDWDSKGASTIKTEVCAEQLQELLNSGDDFLIQVASGYLERGICPTEDEAVEMQGFLSVFTVCCKEFGLPDLSDRFKQRADIYNRCLCKMGFGGYGIKYTAGTTVFGKLYKIINRVDQYVNDIVRILEKSKAGK